MTGRDAGYYVGSTDWPATPYPPGYPSPRQVVDVLAGMDEVWEQAMRDLAAAPPAGGDR